MKALFTYLLIVLMLAQSLLRLGIYVDFKLHQEYIARVLCVNRDKPILACNGQCQLQERLQRTDAQDEDLPNSRSERHELHLFCVIPLDLDWQPAYRDPVVQAVAYRSPFSVAWLQSVFHPPPYASFFV